MRAGKVIRLQMFALQPTPPDFDLIQPRCVGRQPVHLKVQAPFTRLFLLTEPPRELFGRMGSAIVQDEGQRVDLASQGFGNDHLLEKGLEIDKALAAAAGSVNLSIGDRESGKQMACATTMVASFVQQRLAWACWARRLLPLACLDGGFLIGGVPDVFWSGLSEEEISGKNVNTTPKTVTSVETMVAQMPGMIARLLSIQTVETMSAIMTTAMIKRLLRSFLLLRG